MGLKFKRWWKLKTRPARHALVYWAARSAFAPLQAMPIDMALRVGRLLGRAAAVVDRGRRRRSTEQMAAALGPGAATPALDGAGVRRAVLGMYEALGCSFAEMIHLPKVTTDFLERRFEVVGMENYERAAAAGRGVIAITAHFGAWELLPQYAVGVKKRPFVAIAREVKNARIQEWTEKLRRTNGVEIAYRERAGITAVRMLKKGGIVGILADQCTKGPGVFVPFFGRPAHTLTGPAKLALSTKAAVVPAFLARLNAPTRWRLEVGTPIELPNTGNAERDAYELTARITAVIEGIVRKYPEQWMWLHERWKRTPETDEDPVYDPATGAVTPGMKSRRTGEGSPGALPPGTSPSTGGGIAHA